MNAIAGANVAQRQRKGGSGMSLLLDGARDAGASLKSMAEAAGIFIGGAVGGLLTALRLIRRKEEPASTQAFPAQPVAAAAKPESDRFKNVVGEFNANLRSLEARVLARIDGMQGDLDKALRREDASASNIRAIKREVDGLAREILNVSTRLERHLAISAEIVKRLNDKFDELYAQGTGTLRYSAPLSMHDEGGMQITGVKLE